MRELETAAVASGVSEPQLMREAAQGIAYALNRFFPAPWRFVFVCGKGNNGGDGRWAAEELHHLDREAQAISVADGVSADGILKLAGSWALDNVVWVDALLGIGARPGLPAAIRSIVAEYLQDRPGRPVVAIDMPTGVDADTGKVEETAVRARLTLACGLPKRGMFEASAAGQVGRIFTVPLNIPWDKLSADPFLVMDENALGWMPSRRWDAHKGDCGRIRIFAGSLGMAGAAVLAARGALRAGAGLVTLHVPHSIYAVVASQTPEVMVRPWDVPEQALDEIELEDIVVAGPGLGQSETTQRIVQSLLRCPARSIVLDADALNLLAAQTEAWKTLSARFIATPHPGEMRRLMGKGWNDSRWSMAERWAQECEATLVLKGPSTLVSARGHAISANSTGNPGMATGGMGDVLAGMVGAFCAQGLPEVTAARLAVYLHGRAADLAVERGNQSYLSLSPSDALDWLGTASRESSMGSPTST
jgi:NAD(P)H-hydrate epimerase